VCVGDACIGLKTYAPYIVGATRDAVDESLCR
jgi:hypothetical protein